MQIDTTCFFTGHREISPESYNHIYQLVLYHIQNLYKQGITDFVCGGALGFDTLAANAVIEAKQTLDIRLHLVLPHADQSKAFTDEQKFEYERIMHYADSIEVLFEHYVRGCMHQRNRKLVDKSCCGIAFCNKTTGGSAYTVKYAISKNLPIYFVK